MDYSKLIDTASKITLGVVLIVILVAGSQGYWVFGSTYKDAVKDRDEWKALALKGTNLAADSSNRVVSAAAPAAGSVPRVGPNATRDEVAHTLDRLQTRLRPISEPTDEPLP
jgi:hypothetical protein